MPVRRRRRRGLVDGWRELFEFLPKHPASAIACDAWLCLMLASYTAFREADDPEHPRVGLPRSIVNFCQPHTTRTFAGQRDGRWHVYPIDDESRHLASA